MILTALALTGIAQVMAVKTVRRPGLEVPDEEKVLVLSDRFYRFVTDGDTRSARLHCYYPGSGLDVELDDLEYYPSYSSERWIWHDPAGGKVFFAWEDGGNEVREIHIYEIDADNRLHSRMELTGYLPTQWNYGDTSKKSSLRIRDGYIELKGCLDSDTYINGIYDLGMNRGSFPVPSRMNVSPVEVDFFEITGSGINVRTEPDIKAPKLIEEYDEYGCGDSWLTAENDRSGSPYRPYRLDKGDIKVCPRGTGNISGWQYVGEGYVSADFVSPVSPEPVDVGRIIAEKGVWTGSGTNILRHIDGGRYEGLWIGLELPGMDSAGALLFGKTVGDMVVFYGECGLPWYNAEVAGLVSDGRGGLCYGDDRGNPDNGCGYDIAKITEGDIDLLYPTAIPAEWQRYIVILNGKTHIFGM